MPPSSTRSQKATEICDDTTIRPASFSCEGTQPPPVPASIRLGFHRLVRVSLWPKNSKTMHDDHKEMRRPDLHLSLADRQILAGAACTMPRPTHLRWQTFALWADQPHMLASWTGGGARTTVPAAMNASIKRSSIVGEVIPNVATSK